MNDIPDNFTPHIFDAAKHVLINAKSASISLLQRKLKLRYSLALSLMEALERNGVVTPRHFASFRTLTPEFLEPMTANQPMSEREKFIRRVFETALFLWEAHEEGQGGDTRAIKLLSPYRSGSSVLQRKAVFDTLTHLPNATLTQAATALATWGEANSSLPGTCHGIEADLSVICAAQERPYQRVTESAEIRDRSFVRLARYIRRVATEDVPPDTRIFMWFIPDHFVPKGRGKKGTNWGEHVVPRKYLMQTCVELFRKGWSIEDVARVLRHSLAIVYISAKESSMLDIGEANGGLGLKESMPKDWRIGIDCIYARLHAANISFDPIEELPGCVC